MRLNVTDHALPSSPTPSITLVYRIQCFLACFVCFNNLETFATLADPVKPRHPCYKLLFVSVHVFVICVVQRAKTRQALHDAKIFQVLLTPCVIASVYKWPICVVTCLFCFSDSNSKLCCAC